MADEIIKIFRSAYKNGFLAEAQQTKSYLQPFVRNETIEGDKWFVDRMLKDVSADNLTVDPARGAATAFLEYDVQRRTIVPTDVIYSVLIDKIDVLKTVQDPKSYLVQEGIYRMNRKKDELIIEAALGTALTGVTGGTSTTFDSNQVVASGTTGLTKAKMNACDELFYTNDVPSTDNKYLVIGPKQLTDLRGITEFTSFDYMANKPYATGEIPMALGYHVIVSSLVATDGAVRDCFAFSEGALALGMGFEVKTRLEEAQAHNFNWQIFAQMALGATRLHEERVVKIECVEA